MYGDYELKHLAESFERMVRDGTLKGVVPLQESKDSMDEAYGRGRKHDSPVSAALRLKSLSNTHRNKRDGASPVAAVLKFKNDPENQYRDLLRVLKSPKAREIVKSRSYSARLAKEDSAETASRLELMAEALEALQAYAGMNEASDRAKLNKFRKDDVLAKQGKEREHDAIALLKRGGSLERLDAFRKFKAGERRKAAKAGSKAERMKKETDAAERRRLFGKPPSFSGSDSDWARRKEAADRLHARYYHHDGSGYVAKPRAERSKLA